MSRLLALCCFLLAQFYLQGQVSLSHDLDFSDSSQVHLLRTTRGDVLIGHLNRIENDTFYFQLRGAADETIFHLTDLEAVWPSGSRQPNSSEGIYSDQPKKKSFAPAANQLLYSGTAIPYTSNGTYRNTLILWNEFNYQASPHLNFGAGMLVPAMFVAKLQTQVSFNDILHAGFAIQHLQLLIDGPAGATHPYAIVTVGEREKYLNFTFGYWLTTGDFADDPFPMVSIGGSYMLSDRWRFFVEAMAILDGFDNYIVPSFSFSTFGRRNIFDMGVAALPDTDFPLFPVLTYTLLF